MRIDRENEGKQHETWDVFLIFLFFFFLYSFLSSASSAWACEGVIYASKTMFDLLKITAEHIWGIRIQIVCAVCVQAIVTQSFQRGSEW